ncbi:TetR/AcrR family transcriptional regulator [Williamsia sp.]|uniref:TetR/AcrR family transcriptional regulator n=1 Tax=Williamsia sp. TaxID=1872085 RepID=UPI002F95E94E
MARALHSAVGGSTRRSNGNRPSDELLLDAARDVFDLTGYHATSMEAIAERANSTKPTLYAHFGSKERLYRAALEREAGKLRGWLFEAYESAAGLPMEEQVRADMLAFFHYATEHPSGFGLLFGDTASGPAAEVRDDLMQSISGQIAVRIRAYYTQRKLPPPAQSAELLASMLAGIAIHGGRQALALSLPPADVGEFATALAHAGLQHLAPAQMEMIDRQG